MLVEPFVWRLVKTVIGLSVLIVVGALGFALLEGWSLADGFYMTLITLSTVGYGETHELTERGRWFTSALIVACVLGMTFLTAALTSLILGNDLSGRNARKKVLKMISKLKRHTVVCGSGMMAQAVIESLVANQHEVVVVGEDKEQLESLRRRFRGLIILEGNATDELLLAKASVLRASNIVAAMESDIDNLMICITCGDMGRDISVYARSNDNSIANRMRKAGAENVVSPSRLCGDYIANAIAGPSGVSTALEENALA